MSKGINSTSVGETLHDAGQHDKHRGGTRMAQGWHKGWHKGGIGVAQGWLSAVGRNLLMEGYGAMLTNKHGLKCQTFFAERGHKVKANLVNNDNLVQDLIGCGGTARRGQEQRQVVCCFH